MKRTDMLGIRVTLKEDKTIPTLLFEEVLSETKYKAGTVFVVEHDFRDSDEDGIHVGCPDNGWMALTPEQFEDMFGSDALADLNSIRYDLRKLEVFENDE